MKLQGLVPNSYIHVSVLWAIYYLREIEHEKKSNQNGENSIESNVLNCYRYSNIYFRAAIYIYLFILFI